MGISIPLEIQKNWHIFEENGLTDACLYKSIPAGSNPDDYDTNSGVVTPGLTTDESITVIVDEFNQTVTQSAIKRDDDITILSIDRKANFPVLNLTAIPKIDDLLLIDSVDWIVKGISSDPAKAMYHLHIRPINGN